MGFLDKIKNLFTDEEIEEREVRIESDDRPVAPPKLPTVMREEKELQVFHDYNDVTDQELLKTREYTNKFNFPINFDDNDVKQYQQPTTSSAPTNFSREQKREKPREVVQREPAVPVKEPNLEHTIQKPLKEVVLEPYRGNARRNEKPKQFRCTPIISPVYGILDKNYTKDEVVKKDASDYAIPRAGKSIDFESVHKKAYGTLDDELQENFFSDDKDSIKENSISEEELLADIMEEGIDEEENYCDFGVSYEKEHIVKPSKVDIDIDIDVTNEIKIEKEDTKELNFKITNHNEEDKQAEKIEVKEELEDKKETDFDLTDDLFNLIDSMYDERK